MMKQSKIPSRADKKEIKELNIVKKTCKELGLTYRELGKILGYSESSLNSAASTGKITEAVKKAIQMYKKILELEKKLANSERIKETLKEWLK